MLRLEGASLGRIDEVGNLDSTWREWSRKARYILEKHSKTPLANYSSEVAKSTLKYPTGEEFSQVFWRTKCLSTSKSSIWKFMRSRPSDVEEVNKVFLHNNKLKDEFKTYGY